MGKWVRLGFLISGLTLSIYSFLQVKYFIQNQDALIASGKITSGSWLWETWINTIFFFAGLVVMALSMLLFRRKHN